MAVTEEECSTVKTGSSEPASSNGVHYLAKCVLRGSAVLQVVHGRFRFPAVIDVVFGKESSIELVVIGEDGIVQSVCDQPVFGTIKDLAVVPRTNTQSQSTRQKDMLVVISDSGKLSFLTFCSDMHRFYPLTQVPLSNPGNSMRQLGRMLAVDSSGCFLAASAYKDQIAVFSLSVSGGSQVIDKRINYPNKEGADAVFAGAFHKTSIEGTIWSMCFISRDSSQPTKEHKTVLAIILNSRGSAINELLVLSWTVGGQDIDVVSQYVEPGPLIYDIVEVPRSSGYALLFRVGDIFLMDIRNPYNPCCICKTSLNFLSTRIVEQNVYEESCRVHDEDEGLFNVAACLLELGDVDPMCIDGDVGNVNFSSYYACSWSWEPDNDKNPRIIFCVDSGEFFMIEIKFDENDLNVNLSECLYKGLPCKRLLWVEGGFLATFVEMGDGMVLKVDNERLILASTIQNIAPILDTLVMDCHKEKHDQMFACCGVAPEGSLRIVQTGTSVEKLLKTGPDYQGLTGTWSVRMKARDLYHSFLVLSFVEETRILSVGVSFTDVTDSFGFQPDVCTLACGLISDGLLVQIHKTAVRLCLPTKACHSEGVPSFSPICASWSPDNVNISLGAVGQNFIIVSTSNPYCLRILGVRSHPAYHYEIYEIQQLRLQHELSCISIPQEQFKLTQFWSNNILFNDKHEVSFSTGYGLCNTFAIGTHKPSVEILSFLPNEGIKVLAAGILSLTNTMATAISGCIPQDVKLVLVDRLYVLAGLRNGMLLRFEWPSPSTLSSIELHSCGGYSVVNADAATREKSGISFVPQHAVDLTEKAITNIPINLQLIATRRIGITPVFLVPLSDSLDADVIALSGRPWLVQTARRRLSYTSISLPPSTLATPVCSAEFPKGILFVAENSLHLVEMVHSKRFNEQKFHLGGTPRKVLYHSHSKLLLVMRTDLSNDSSSSDICCVDSLSGLVYSSFKLEVGETGKDMNLVRVGNELVLVVGTSLSSGPAIMPSGEAESTKGRLIVLYVERLQHLDSDSMTSCPKAGLTSQRSSPFHEIIGYAAEQLSSSSLCGSPSDNSIKETETWQLRLAYSATWPGVVLAICPYLDRYFLASAGNAFYICGFSNGNPQRVKKYAVAKTRFMIMSITAHFTRIAVGDCRDGILFYSYHEESRRLELVYCDPLQRLIGGCTLIDVDTAVVSDRKGGIAVLSCSGHSEATLLLPEDPSPECNLKINCAYYMGEVAISIKKGSLRYKLPASELKGYDSIGSIDDASQSTIIVSTLLGSVIVFIPLSREEHELLEAVQDRLAVHPLTAPVLGNDHNEFRCRENPVGVPKILDGDMLAQFSELTTMQQEEVLSLRLPTPTLRKSTSKLCSLSHIPLSPVTQLLERIHYALN